MQDLITQQLEKLQIPYEHFEHEPVFTAEEGRKIYQQSGIQGAHVKNLFLRNKKGSQHYLVTVMADKDVDLKELSETVEDRKLGFASPERLDTYLRIKPGSVSPLALVNDAEKHVKVVFDEDIRNAEKIHIHPGINTESVVIAVEDLEQFVTSLDYEIFWTNFA